MIVVTVLDMPSAYGSLHVVSMAEKAEPQAPVRREGVEDPGRRGKNRALHSPAAHRCFGAPAACPPYPLRGLSGVAQSTVWGAHPDSTPRGNRLGVPINDLLSAKAVDGVIVDHAGGLHMGVADGRADELEAALVQILTQRIGFRAGGRIILQSAESVDHGRMINEAPDIGRKAAEGCLYVKKPLGIGDGRMDFLPVADNAGVLQQRRNV